MATRKYEKARTNLPLSQEEMEKMTAALGISLEAVCRSVRKLCRPSRLARRALERLIGETKE